MPGRLILTSDIAAVAEAFSADPGGLDEPPRRNIAPGQELVTLGPDRSLRKMRWGLIPVGRVNARGRPVMETIVNARSETVFAKSAFAGVGRCIVPADGWYEWTGKARRKTAWRIGLKSGAVMGFAAISDVWRGLGGVEVPQVATVTCAPNADIEPIHHRMGVILAPEDFATWLEGSEEDAAALMRPLANGLLRIVEAEGVDWTAP